METAKNYPPLEDTITVTGEDGQKHKIKPLHFNDIPCWDEKGQRYCKYSGFVSYKANSNKTKAEFKAWCDHWNIVAIMDDGKQPALQKLEQKPAEASEVLDESIDDKDQD